jgi:hypothetical protein
MAVDPLLSPKPPRVIASDPQAVRVKATGRGVYGGIVRELGEIFYVDGVKYKPAKSMWMQVLPDEDEKPITKAAKPLMP